MTFEDYRGWHLPNQDASVARNVEWKYTFLDILIDAANAVERATGHKWKATSYIRNSPSHRYLYALDIAPDISPSSASKYAVYNNSDPVLYKRVPLMNALKKAAASLPNYRDYDVGFFVEPDHIHIHVFRNDRGDKTSKHIVVQWKVPKEIYSDTVSRMKLPVTTQGYTG